MRTRLLKVWWVALGLTLLVSILGACKSEAGRVCDRLEELMTQSGEADNYSEQACVDHVGGQAERCANFDDMVACWVAAEDMPAFGRCRALCQAGEGTGP